jgi:hypothetical protein
MHAFLAALLVTLAASVAHALPAWRPLARAGGYAVIPGDHGSCAKMGQLCASDIGTDYNALVASGAFTLNRTSLFARSPSVPGSEFGVSARCTLSAMCQQMFYNGTVDDWIETYFGVRSDDSAPAGSYSHNATALPDDVSVPFRQERIVRHSDASIFSALRRARGTRRDGRDGSIVRQRIQRHARRRGRALPRVSPPFTRHHVGRFW